jgi:hypothetical protein
MKFEVDQDVQAVAEFMQRSIPAARLVGVAAALNALAPLLWGEGQRALQLREPPIAQAVA